MFVEWETNTLSRFMYAVLGGRANTVDLQVLYNRKLVETLSSRKTLILPFIRPIHQTFIACYPGTFLGLES